MNGFIHTFQYHFINTWHIITVFSTNKNMLLKYLQMSLWKQGQHFVILKVHSVDKNTLLKW